MKTRIIIVLLFLFARTSVASPDLMLIDSTGSIAGQKFSDFNQNGVKDLSDTGVANWQITATTGAGNAMEFNGTTDAVGPDFIFPTVSDSFTMEMWVLPTGARNETPEVQDGNYGGIAQRYAVYPTRGDFYGYYHAGAGISIGTNGISVFEHYPYYLPSLLVFDTTLSGWHHVAVVYYHNQPKLYLDGILVRTGLQSIMTVHPSSVVGGHSYGPFAGTIDEVRWWDTCRTQEQIQASMYKRLEGNESRLIRYFRFDEEGGTTVHDATSYGHPGETNSQTPTHVESTAPMEGLSYTTTTDGSGNYQFSNLPAGNYGVWEVPRSGWRQTFPTTGEYSVTLADNENRSGVDFGNYQIVGSIGGVVFDDANGNGSYDTGEQVLSNHMIHLDGLATDSILTDGDGRYIFSRLLPGGYTISMQPDSGWQLLLPISGNEYHLNLSLEQDVNDKNFILYKLGEIHGKQFNDINANGIQDTTEPGLSGWEIRLQQGYGDGGIALQFNGNGYIYEGYVSSSTAVGTFEMWVNLSDSTLGGLIDADNCGGNFIQVNADRTVASGYWVCNATVGSTLYSKTKLGLNEWHHITRTWNPTAHKLYIDGVLEAIDTVHAWAVNAGGLSVHLGHRHSNGDDRGYYFNGKMDEVRIWNYARSQGEILRDIHHTLGGAETGLLAYWKFDEGSGSTTYDASGHGFNGAITLQSWLPSTAPLVYRNDSVLTDSNGDYSFGSVPYGISTVQNVTQQHWLLTKPTSPGYYRFLLESGSSSENNDFGNAVGYLLQVHDYWNLVSLPVMPLDKSGTGLRAIANAPLYSFKQGGGYQMQDTLMMGKGYWIRSHGAAEVQVPGLFYDTDTVVVSAGWNLIGSLRTTMAVNQITSSTPGMKTSQFYGYTNIYSATDSLYPGKGYWVKASVAGNLILSSTVLTNSATKITIVPIDERPPVPPDGNEISSNDTKTIPSEFGLSQNFPNPFNPSSVIRYRLATDGVVTLKVYTTLGVEVTTLVNSMQEAGFKSVVFDGSNLPSGVYYYRMQVVPSIGSGQVFSDIKKMMLVK